MKVVLACVVAMASALRSTPCGMKLVRPTPKVSRKAFFSGVVGAGVLGLTQPARAFTLDSASQLVGELAGLKSDVKNGKANARKVKSAQERTLAPLSNAMTKNPLNEKTDYGDLIATKMSKDLSALGEAVDAKDGFAPLRSSTGDISYPAGRVEKLLTKMVESTDAYCQIVDCDNLLIYR